MDAVKQLSKKLGIYNILSLIVDYWRLLLCKSVVVARLVPINKRKIVIDNFHGEGFGQNPRYIVEELHKLDSSIQFVWITKKNTIISEKYIKTVKYGSLKSYWELATAKVWIDNVRDFIKPLKREGQIYLQTWHGTYGPKLSEGDAINCLSPQYIRKAKADGAITDAILVHSALQEEAFKRAYWLNERTEYLRFGLPRNDLLYKAELANNFLKDELNIEKDEYVVLYAPTFRDDGDNKGYIFEVEKVRKAFSEAVEKNVKLIIRLHPNALEQETLYQYNQNVLNGNAIADFQSLVGVADCLITDYSTTSLDFAICRKPVFLYTSDITEMIKRGRIDSQIYGFPFSISKNIDELVDVILQFDLKEYLCEVEKFFKNNPVYDDGDSSERTAKWIMKKMIS